MTYYLSVDCKFLSLVTLHTSRAPINAPPTVLAGTLLYKLDKHTVMEKEHDSNHGAL